jgi:hypothetical protein
MVIRARNNIQIPPSRRLLSCILAHGSVSLYSFVSQITLNSPTVLLHQSQLLIHLFLDFMQIITQEGGQKCYGVCLIYYQKPSAAILSWIDHSLEEWRSKNAADTDLKYIQGMQSKLAAEKERLLKLNYSSIKSLQTLDEIKTAQENVAVYEEMVGPLQLYTVTADQVYIPTCIGISSKWPFYDFFGDWLCRVYQSLEMERGYHDSCIERCVINLIKEVPLPPPGKLELAITIQDLSLYYSRPPPNTIPILKNVSSYNLVFFLSRVSISFYSEYYQSIRARFGRMQTAFYFF